MDDFDRWNKLKKELQLLPDEPSLYPKQREVWMCSVGKNIGFEQNGAGESFSRPVLVVKKFNNKMFWVLPLSTKQKSYDFYFNFIDPNGLKVAAILAQLRLISIKRFRRHIYEFDPSSFEVVKHRLQSWLN